MNDPSHCHKRALQLLEQAFESGFRDIERLQRDVSWAPLSTNPEFQQLEQKIRIRSYENEAKQSFLSGNYRDAIPIYSSLLELAKGKVDYLLARGWCFHMQQDYANAVQDYDAGLESCDVPSVRVTLLSNKSFLYATSSNPQFQRADLALQFAQQACQIADTDGFAVNALACSHAIAGNFKKAIQLEEQALKDSKWAHNHAIDGGVYSYFRLKCWSDGRLWLPEL